MTDIITGIGGYSSNHESYESNPFDLFYDPEFKESIGEPIIVEYRPGNNEGENGVPYNFEFSSESNMYIRLDNARIRGKAKIVKSSDGSSPNTINTVIVAPPPTPPAQDGQTGQQVIIAICFLQTQPWSVGWSMETFNANLN